jgi:hypothetical protein
MKPNRMDRGRGRAALARFKCRREWNGGQHGINAHMEGAAGGGGGGGGGGRAPTREGRGASKTGRYQGKAAQSEAARPQRAPPPPVLLQKSIPETRGHGVFWGRRPSCCTRSSLQGRFRVLGSPPAPSRKSLEFGVTVVSRGATTGPRVKHRPYEVF